ncbi:MAG: HlyC/CorC family transporter, partial [Planctomycetaceae bacterium]|nr:HlyC/CorC family transporter [Planctomycetaceae bacterium]
CLSGLLLMFGGVEHYTRTAVLEAMIGTVIMAVLCVGILPAVWARHATEKILARFLPLFDSIAWFFAPFVKLSNALHAGVAKVRGDEAGAIESKEEEFEEDIEDHLDEAERDGVITGDERKIISSALEFSDETIESIMTPRTEVMGISVEEGIDTAMALACAHGHSRLPVFESDSRDRIVGIFYVRDAARYWKARGEQLPPLKEIMRAPMFVPESKKLDELLKEFRAKRTQIAVVLDEFGGTAGIVTMEDVLEELVGDLQDEFDWNEAADSPTGFRRISPDVIEVDARMKVDDLNHEFDCKLPESSEYTSVGGLIAAHLGRIPRIGERVPLDDVHIKVIEANERSVRKIRITRGAVPAVPDVTARIDRLTHPTGNVSKAKVIE